MQTWDLEQWLTYLESIHSKNIDMGLTRVEQVFSKLALNFSQSTVVTVAGTNGKGTTCAVLEQAALEVHKKVGVYSSPHIVRYTERVRINGKELPESAHCEAFWPLSRHAVTFLLLISNLVPWRAFMSLQRLIVSWFYSRWG